MVVALVYLTQTRTNFQLITRASLSHIYGWWEITRPQQRGLDAETWTAAASSGLVAAVIAHALSFTNFCEIMARTNVRIAITCVLIAQANALRLHATSRQRVGMIRNCAEPMPMEGDGIVPALNVLGLPLECCCADVGGSGIGTGFYRDGHCSTGPLDEGKHTVCIVATAEFLEFSKSVGNDLSTPIPEYQFPGVKPGDQWCLCATRWIQALQSGAAPKLHLMSTHERTLSVVTESSRTPLLEALKLHAVDLDEAEEKISELNAKRAKLEGLL